MFDFSQVTAFAAKLAADHIDEKEWARTESAYLAEAMDPPVRTGTLQQSIRPTDKGVAIDADYWVHVEYGNSRQGPQPFVRPAITARSGPASAAAGKRIIDHLTK